MVDVGLGPHGHSTSPQVNAYILSHLHRTHPVAPYTARVWQGTQP